MAFVLHQCILAHPSGNLTRISVGPYQLMHLCQTRACLSSRIVMIRLWNKQFLKSLHRKKSSTLRSGDRDHWSGAVAMYRFGKIAWPARSSDLSVPDFSYGDSWETVCSRDSSITQASRCWRICSYWCGPTEDASTTTSRRVCRNALMKTQALLPMSF